eukprot:TRINITY_DN35356_c0_g1_i1.p1 TRINITY_DN35356_c0_g1~~TRINITY_DN35356_c0_g1_i1.p1  ORF type:complete len:742 (+),score=133.45 TRINITY_DN35356_c0_g1_i1:128-2353(+)
MLLFGIRCALTGGWACPGCEANRPAAVRSGTCVGRGCLGARHNAELAATSAASQSRWQFLVEDFCEWVEDAGGKRGRGGEAISRPQGQQDGKDVVAAVRRVAEQGEFEGRELSRILSAAARLDAIDEDMAAVLRSSARNLQALSSGAGLEARDLSDSAWALARMAIYADVVGWFMRQLPMNGLRFSVIDVAKLVWACATLQVADARTFGYLGDAALQQIAPKLDQPRAPDAWSSLLPNIAWAYAKMRVWHAQLLRTVVQLAMTRKLSFKPQGVANVAWALAKLLEAEDNLYPIQWFSCLAAEADDEAYKPQELCNILWSLAAATASEAESLRVLLRRAEETLPRFAPQGLANVLWAAAKLGGQSSRRFGDAAIPSVRRHVTKFNEQELVNIAWAYAATRQEDSAVLASLSTAITARVSKLNAQDVANTAWAFAKLVHVDVAVFEALTRQLPSFGRAELLAQDISNLAWAYASVELSEKNVFLFLLRRASVALGNFSMQAISNLCWACAVTGDGQSAFYATVKSELVTRRIPAMTAYTPRREEAAGWALNLLGVVWAMNFAEVIDEGMLLSVAVGLRGAGERVDSGAASSPRGQERCVPMDASLGDEASDTQLPRSSRQPNKSMSPFVVVDTMDYLVLLKPPGWEVDTASAAVSLEASVGKDEARGPTLSAHIRGMVDGVVPPIWFDDAHQRGFLHRLDVPSSAALHSGSCLPQRGQKCSKRRRETRPTIKNDLECSGALWS